MKPIAKQHSQRHPLDGSLLAVQHLLVLITVAVFIIAFIAQPFQIPSGSMEPTLRIGDFLLVDKQIVPVRSLLPSTRIQRGDIVVFHYPVDPAIDLVKRVVALPGDRIRLHAGKVFLNGALQPEPFTLYQPPSPGQFDSFRDNFPSMATAEPGVQSRWWIEMRSRIHEGDLLVPPGRYFVLGDNRNNSEDSRFWGFVPEQAIVGKPLVIYFSVRLREPPVRLADTLRGRFIDRVAHFARWNRTLTIVH